MSFGISISFHFYILKYLLEVYYYFFIKGLINSYDIYSF